MVHVNVIVIIEITGFERSPNTNPKVEGDGTNAML